MNRFVKISLVVLTLSIFWIVSAPRLANWVVVEKKLRNADVIFVLSGSAVYKERVQKAASEYRAGISKTLLLSDDGGNAGWSNSERRNPKFVELEFRALEHQGVAAESIEVMDGEVTSTIDEANGFRKLALSRGWKSVLVVTSRYHTRRALRTFERTLEGTGIAVGITAPDAGDRMPPAKTWWLTRKGWVYVGGEYLKSVYYWLFY